MFLSECPWSNKDLRNYFYKVKVLGDNYSKSFRSVKEASNYYGIHQSTIYRNEGKWIKKLDKLKCLKTDKSIYTPITLVP